MLVIILMFLFPAFSSPVVATPSPSDIAALRHFDSQDLVSDAQASENLLDARIAALAYNEDPDLLLAIAWHESNFTISHTIGAGGLDACGIMTPVPMQHCVSASILDGYMAGAAHLRDWLDAEHDDEHQALLGYAGGYKLIRGCAKGPVMVKHGDHMYDNCHTPAVFKFRQRQIQRLRAAASVS